MGKLGVTVPLLPGHEVVELAYGYAAYLPAEKSFVFFV